GMWAVVPGYPATSAEWRGVSGCTATCPDVACRLGLRRLRRRRAGGAPSVRATVSENHGVAGSIPPLGTPPLTPAQKLRAGRGLDLGTVPGPGAAQGPHGEESGDDVERPKGRQGRRCRPSGRQGTEMSAGRLSFLVVRGAGRGDRKHGWTQLSDRISKVRLFFDNRSTGQRGRGHPSVRPSCEHCNAAKASAKSLGVSPLATFPMEGKVSQAGCEVTEKYRPRPRSCPRS